MSNFPRILTAAACLLVTIADGAAQNRTFTSQYTFGDSLSDSGNVFALTRGTQPPAPYYNGRFSNGPVFSEQLGNPIVPAATISAARGNLNFAYGGATAGTGGAVPNLAQQIGQYRLQGLPAARTDLFTVLAGANDMIAVLGSPATPANPASIDVAGAAAAQSAAASVQTLVGLGAKNLVVLGLPNLGITPRSLAAGGAGGTGSIFGLRATNAFNHELRARLGAIAAGAADVNLVYVDLQGVLDRLALDYRALGYTNATSYFLAPAAQGGGSGDPNGYIFWDDIHPTAKTHATLAAIVLEELNPEPVLGFGATAGSAALALQGLAAGALDDRIAQLAAAKRAPGRADAFASYNYGDGDRAADGWRPQFDFTAQVVTAGVDLLVRDGFFVGGAVDAGRLAATVGGGRGRFTVEDNSARLYGVWRGGPVSLAIDADYGTIAVKGIRRTTAFGGFPTSARTSGDHWGAGLKAAWEIDHAGMSVRPWLGLRTERVKLKAYDETDVPSLMMGYEAQEAKSSAAAAGVDVGTGTKLGGRMLRLDLRAAWHGEIGSDHRAVAGRLANNFTQRTTVSVEDGDGSGFAVGGAATLFFAKNWSASLGYTADLRSDDQVASRAMFSVQTGF